MEQCPDCQGTGIEHSGVCYCGAEMEGHSNYDNHTATEMTRPCQTCTRDLIRRKMAVEAEETSEHGLTDPA